MVFILLGLFVFVVFMATLVQTKDLSRKDNVKERLAYENSIKDELGKLGEIKYVDFINNGYIAIIDDYIQYNLCDYENKVYIKDILKTEINYDLQGIEEMKEKSEKRFSSVIHTRNTTVKLREIKFVLYLKKMDKIVLTINPQYVNPYKIIKVQSMLDNMNVAS
ncbi:hypothetical protein [Terrisporobacter mayombei]|uniref:Uncharacterized protein n=1 Tax=Terrisporobacter mayombei TaxID=1541 RepID=A0ABY9Q0Q1_9FIRM|nr:hypothetical protein [Terrisporobacter mayombei]MCC3866631.1 hypothetical protein [Terrisporobacter mayombei]WMT80865.1 hypothetical protein TEMA_11870 [Terrisporobacter mayombei]